MGDGKKTYCVAVTALGSIRRVINVEAEDEEEAEKLALDKAEEEGDIGWEFNGRFNDGQPHSELDATEVEEGEDSLDG